MTTLLQDIKTQSEWITKAFAADRLNLDYTIHSFIEIDKFFNRHAKDGKALTGGRLKQNPGAIIFSLGAYVGETIIKNIPGSVWETDDNDPEGELNAIVKLPDESIIYPMHRIMKRFQNGAEDSVYVYGFHLTKEYITEEFDEAFWQIDSQEKYGSKKAWWRFW